MEKTLNSPISPSLRGNIALSSLREEDTAPSSNPGMTDLDQRIANLREKLANLAQTKAELSNSVENLTGEYKDVKRRERMAKRVWKELRQSSASSIVTRQSPRFTNEPEEGEPENPIVVVTRQNQQALHEVERKNKREDDKEKNDEDDSRFSNDRQRRLASSDMFRYTGKRDRDCYETSYDLASSQSNRSSNLSPLSFMSQLPPLISPPLSSRPRFPNPFSDLLALQKEIFQEGTAQLISDNHKPLAKVLMDEANYICINLLKIIQSDNNPATLDCLIAIQSFHLVIRDLKAESLDFSTDENYKSQILYRASDLLHTIRNRLTPYDQQHINKLCQTVCSFLEEQLKMASIFTKYETHFEVGLVFEKERMLDLIQHKFSLTLWPLIAWISHNGDSSSQLFLGELTTLLSRLIQDRAYSMEYPYALLLPTPQLIQMCGFNIETMHEAKDKIVWTVFSEVLLKEIEYRNKIHGDSVGQDLYKLLYHLTAEVEEIEDHHFIINELINLLNPSPTSVIKKNAYLSLKICDMLDHIKWRGKKYTRQAFRALHMAILGQPEEAIKLYVAGETFPNSSTSRDTPIWIHIVIAILYNKEQNYKSARNCLLRLGSIVLQDQDLSDFYKQILKNIPS